MNHTKLAGMQKDRGVALVLVLWIVVLLSVIGVSHSRNVRIDMQIARHHLDNARAKAMAEAGLNRAIMELFNKDEQTRWPYNGEVTQMDFEDGVVQIMIRNTAGLVDINTASQDLLEKLFSLVEMEQNKRLELVDAIMDWRDPDDLKRLNGAEDNEYHLEGLDYGTPDRKFFSIGELRYVLGMDTSIYNTISPFITVFSGMGDLNLNVAPVELVNLFQTNGDQMFGADSFGGRGFDNGNNPRGSMILGDLSKVFHISVWATLENGAAAGLEVDVDTTRNVTRQYSIVSWQESSQG